MTEKQRLPVDVTETSATQPVKADRVIRLPRVLASPEMDSARPGAIIGVGPRPRHITDTTIENARRKEPGT
jgi:hypothetical protein